MKKSVILDIFNGEADREWLDLKRRNKRKPESCKDYEELRQKLSPELFDLHQKIEDNLVEGLCEEIDYYFAEGFKLGLLIAIECLQE